MSVGNSGEEINVALTADFSNLQTGMAGGAAAVKGGTDAMAASMADFTAASKIFDNILDKNITSFEELAAAESALDVVQKAGVHSTADVAAAFKALDAVEKELTKTAAITAAAMEKAAKAAAEMAVVDTKVAQEARVAAAAITEQTVATGALGGMTAGTTRELSVMLGEGLRGNYTRLIGSTTTLARTTGLLQMVFTPMGLAIGAVVAAMGGLIYGTFEAEKTQQEFATTLALTGSASGVTIGKLNQLSDSLHAVTHDQEAAQEATLEMVKSGKIEAGQMYDIGVAAIQMSKMTGQSIEQVIAEFAKLRDDPVKAVVELNNQYHFLTVAVYEHIKALDEAGDHQGAADAGMAAFASHIHRTAQQEIEDAHGVLYAWMQVKEFFSNIKGMASHALAPTDDDALGALIIRQKELNDVIAYRKKAGDDFSAKTWELDQVNKEIAAYKVKAAAQQQAADTAKKIADDLAGHTIDAKADRAATEGDRRQFEEQQLAHRMSLQDEQVFWQAKLQSAKKGTDEYDQALRESVSIKRQLDSKSDHASSAGAKEAHSEIMRGLKEERDATLAGSKERVAADERELAAAMKLYHGKGAEVHRLNEQLAADNRARNAQMIKDDIATDAQETMMDLQALTNAKALADAKRDTDRAALQDALAAKRMTNSQVLEAERKLDAEQLAADIAYYTKKAQLDKGDVKTVMADLAQIGLAREQARQADLKADAAYHKQIQRANEQTAHKIQTTMSGALKGIIIQGNSLRSTMQSVFSDMAGQAIDWVTKTVMSHITGEAAKTAATVAGAGARTGAEAVAATTSTALTAGAAIKNIITNGAEVFTSIYKAIAGIPYVGPFLAPAMAVAGMGVVIGMVSRVASAAGGWGQVPSDQLAQIHKDEMVLPADLASGLRSVIASGRQDSKGDTHIHIHTMDTKTMKRWAYDNAGLLAKAVSGHAGNMRPGG